MHLNILRPDTGTRHSPAHCQKKALGSTLPLPLRGFGRITQTRTPTLSFNSSFKCEKQTAANLLTWFVDLRRPGLLFLYSNRIYLLPK